MVVRQVKYSKTPAAVTYRYKISPLDEAVIVIKIERAAALSVDPQQAEQMILGMVNQLSGTGKTVRVAVFAKGEKAREAILAGADVVGADDLAEKVQAGQIGFDRVIATPDMMPLVVHLGRILGPLGLMPNPKLGTVTPNVKDAVMAAKGEQVLLRVEKAGDVYAGPEPVRARSSLRLRKRVLQAIEQGVRFQAASLMGGVGQIVSSSPLNFGGTMGGSVVKGGSIESQSAVAQVHVRRARIAKRTAWLEESSLMESLNQTLMRLDTTMGEVRDSLDELRKSTKLQVDYLQTSIVTIHERFDKMEAEVASKTDVRGLNSKLDILLSHMTSVEAKPDSPAESAQPSTIKKTRRRAKSGSS